MSAPMILTSKQLDGLARALEELTAIRHNYGVRIAVYSTTDIAIGDTTVAIGWDDDLDQYVIDDRNGS